MIITAKEATKIASEAYINNHPLKQEIEKIFQKIREQAAQGKFSISHEFDWRISSDGASSISEFFRYQGYLVYFPATGFKGCACDIYWSAS